MQTVAGLTTKLVAETSRVATRGITRAVTRIDNGASSRIDNQAARIDDNQRNDNQAGSRAVVGSTQPGSTTVFYYAPSTNG